MCRTVGMPRKDMKGPNLLPRANLDFVCKQGLRVGFLNADIKGII